MRPIDIDFCRQYLISDSGVVVNSNTGKSLRYDLSSAGYRRVTLWGTNQKRVRVTVHRLVAMTYLDNPEGKPIVNHKDGDKLNNHYTNLEWVTCKENTRHAFDTGLREGPNRMPDSLVAAIKSNKSTKALTRAKFCKVHGIGKHRYDDVGRYYK